MSDCPFDLNVKARSPKNPGINMKSQKQTFQIIRTYGWDKMNIVKLSQILGTFRSENECNFEYEFSVLSTRTSKNVGLQTLCACSVRKTCTRRRRLPAIRGLGPVSRKSRNYTGHFRVPQFPLYLKNGEDLSRKTSQTSFF